MARATYPRIISAAEMQPGDIVTPAWSESRVSPFDAAVVKDVNPTLVTLWRPYGTSTDFVTTAGVIVYTGMEQYQIEVSRKDAPYTLWQSSTRPRE